MKRPNLGSMVAASNRIAARHDLTLARAALRLALGEGVAVVPSELVLAEGRGP